MHQKIIGILGGMGPEATLDLYGKIIRATPAEKDQDHLRVIIDSNPKVPDRTPAIIGDGEDPVPAMAESGKTLERAGVDFIIIPCISAHFFLENLQKALEAPILSAFGAVADRIENRHPDVKRVGLLATSGTIIGGKFEARLLQSGVKTMAPGPENQQKVMDAIYKIKSSRDETVRRQCKANLLSAAEHLIEKGAMGIIAGCTEIPLELKAGDLSVPLFDPLRILAESAVEKARI